MIGLWLGLPGQSSERRVKYESTACRLSANAGHKTGLEVGHSA